MAQPVESTLNSADGTRLFCRRWPVQDAQTVVAIIHGYADHSGRYAHVAEFLNQADIDVWAVDLRGHGKSDGKRGHISRFSNYLDDVDALLKKIDVGNRTLFILGHSMGGLVAMHHAIHRRPKCHGLAVSSPFLGVAAKIPPLKAWLGKVMSEIYPSLALASGIDPSDLSHDEGIVQAYREDPLVFKTATARWFTETMKAIEEVKLGAVQIRLPFLVMQAVEDRLADPKASRPLFEKVSYNDKTYIQYPGFYHEIFNEVGRSSPLHDFWDWMTGHI